MSYSTKNPLPLLDRISYGSEKDKSVIRKVDTRTEAIRRAFHSAKLRRDEVIETYRKNPNLPQREAAKMFGYRTRFTISNIICSAKKEGKLDKNVRYGAPRHPKKKQEV